MSHLRRSYVYVPVAYVVHSVTRGYSRYVRWLTSHANFPLKIFIVGQGYTFSCDWWSLGVILFECLYGYGADFFACTIGTHSIPPCITRYPPFVSNSRHITRQKILNWRQALRFPSRPRVSPEGVDLMQRLLCEPEDRLGSQSTVSTSRPNSLIVSVRRSGFFGHLGGGGGTASIDGAEHIKVRLDVPGTMQVICGQKLTGLLPDLLCLLHYHDNYRNADNDRCFDAVLLGNVSRSTWGACAALESLAAVVRGLYPLTIHRPQAHVWFKGIDWDNIHRMEAPFVPQLRNPEDTRHFDQDIPAEVRIQCPYGAMPQKGVRYMYN